MIWLLSFHVSVHSLIFIPVLGASPRPRIQIRFWIFWNSISNFEIQVQKFKLGFESFEPKVLSQLLPLPHSTLEKVLPRHRDKRGNSIIPPFIGFIILSELLTGEKKRSRSCSNGRWLFIRNPSPPIPPSQKTKGYNMWRCTCFPKQHQWLVCTI